jgi:hypothetical protein
LNQLLFRLFLAGLLAMLSGLALTSPSPTNVASSRYWIDQVKQNVPVN